MAEQGVHVRWGTPFDRLRAGGVSVGPRPPGQSRDYSINPARRSMRMSAPAAQFGPETAVAPRYAGGIG